MSKARIGVGFTTYKRKNIMQKAYDKFISHTFNVVQEAKDGGMLTSYTPKDGNEYFYYCAKDTVDDRKGVAARKNECLRALSNCDYVFLFDDDCYPNKDGWANFFIESGQEHLLYLNDTHQPYEVNMHYNKTDDKEFDRVVMHKECGGVFMFMTKGAIERVGAFNEDYDTWGFEHAGYSVRILGDRNAFPMLKGTSDYIYSHDYSDPDFKSSIKDEEKNALIQKNLPIFVEDIKTEHIPL